MNDFTGVSVHAQHPDGRIRLVLQDIRSVDEQSWRTENLFTHVDVDATAFAQSTLDSSIVEALGENIAIRLAAQSGLVT